MKNEPLFRVLLILVFYLLVAISVYLTSGNQPNFTLSGSEEKGLKLWQNQGCMTCHSIYGLGGHMGPDLTNVISQYDANYVKLTIRYGRRKMPAYELDEKDLDAIVHFLKKINKSGKFPVDNIPEDYFGSGTL